jgi:ankyrin repeat protein
MELVNWFLSHGADPNASCAWDLTPVSWAIYAAPLTTIDYLFARGADARYGQLLHWAVIRDKSDALNVVRRVVERGVPINEVKYEMDSISYSERVQFGLGAPLHRAAEFGKTDVVKYLLTKGADPFKLDSKGKTPRFWAEKRSYAETASVLRKAEGSFSATRLRRH